mgnify:CR=1 FL=1
MFYIIIAIILDYSFSFFNMNGSVVNDVPISNIPTIPIILAMDIVFAPSRVPLNIKKAPIKANDSPIMNWIVNLFL